MDWQVNTNYILDIRMILFALAAFLKRSFESTRIIVVDELEKICNQH